MPVLTVNADDYGYAPQYDAGIVEAAAAGAIDGVSVMVMRGAVDPGPLEGTGIAVGLHVELDGEGLVEQVDAFEAVFGRPPTHLDGHHHCHGRGTPAVEVADFARERGIPVRSVDARHRRLLRCKGVETRGSAGRADIGGRACAAVRDRGGAAGRGHVGEGSGGRGVGGAPGARRGGGRVATTPAARRTCGRFWSSPIARNRRYGRAIKSPKLRLRCGPARGPSGPVSASRRACGACVAAAPASESISAARSSRQGVEAGHRVVVADEAEVERAVVAHDPDADALASWRAGPSGRSACISRPSM